LPLIATVGSMTPQRLATVIRQLRERADLTQEELAKRAKITRSHLSLLEAGHRKNPSLDVLKRLARALGVPVGELLE
jgi:transcriptional regulator with XRE-family HTH domain